MSPGPGPGYSLGSTNLHPWLFVLTLYPIGACWVRTSESLRSRLPSLTDGETEAQRGKGQLSGRIQWSPVVFPSTCWLKLLSPEALVHAEWLLEQGGDLLGITWASSGSVKGSACPAGKGARGEGW